MFTWLLLGHLGDVSGGLRVLQDFTTQGSGMKVAVQRSGRAQGAKA